MHTSLQPLGECHCWWTRVSPRAHVATFYVRLQLIRSVLKSIQIFRVEIYWNCNLKIYYTPFGFSFFWYFCDISIQLFKLLYLAIKNNWWGYCTRNAHMVHIVNEIRFNMCKHLDPFLDFNHFTHLVSVTAGGPKSPWGHMQPSSTVDFSWFVAFREHQH